MALVGNDLYVANSDAVLRFPYAAGDTRITAPGVKLVDLPAGPINHHWTKNLIASPDGSKLYVTVGSNSNVAERRDGRWRRGVPPSGRWTSGAGAPHLRLRPAQPEWPGLGTRTAAPCGRW